MKRPVAELAGLHLAGNAMLLWLGYYWLGIGESDAAHLAWSAAVVLALALGALWLHGTAMALFGESERRFGAAARTAFRHLAPLFVGAIAAGVLYGLLAWWHDSFGHKAFVIGSYATMKLRKPVAPARVLDGFEVVIWLLRWMAVPAILFRLGASVAVRGWAGFRLPWAAPRLGWLYGIAVCGLLVCAIWAPLKLIDWVPHAKEFGVQMASFVSRLGAGYLLFAGGLLAVEFLTSSGRPRASQANTVASP
ncbi:MAG: hypothetical protein JO340_17915 [Acidobacteriaceae bacterium]|nr:hypothetical protein [Acidobacteriaceae bacterium]